MSQAIVYPSQAFASQANTTPEQYRQRYQASIADNEAYWAQEAHIVDWITPFSQVKQCSYKADDFNIGWYLGGQLNVAHNCVDRHAASNPSKTAIIWEGDDPTQSRKVSYGELQAEVGRFANILKQLGVQKGDRVTIYLPMVVEVAYAMLACTRIGAVHSVVFAGFSADSLAGRIADCQSSMVITADEGLRGGKTIALKATVDQALQNASTACVKHVLVVKRTGCNIHWHANRDHCYSTLCATTPSHCPVEAMDAESPLFILYTSGSTGKPKGVLHTTAGYLVYAASTFKHVFDYKDTDVFWCTADAGWITGHTYLLYGALANGATTVMFEGVPQYPTWARLGQVVDKHQVSILYTAPTAIRAIAREGDHYVKQSARTSLRLLGSVGEPINPEAWQWYYDVIGNGRCPVVDTWWQTETGGCLITPIPNSVAMKPGAASLPFYGITPAIVDANGTILQGACEGNLVLLDSWPGQMRTVYGDHQRFIDTYFSTYPGMYFTGDGAKRDSNGTYWITGRVDDVLNVSGHRLGTAEVESALVAHPAVAEAAVVGLPHAIKGQGIAAFVSLDADETPTAALKQELVTWVRKEIGPIATIDAILWAPSLPKTRSGKIMRRILRKLVEQDFASLGDTSTLADPSVVDALISEVKSTLG